ncbi:MAG: hypothetical protein Q9216_005858 [Gyalolechia sp. 2 TL-2023]
MEHPDSMPEQPWIDLAENEFLEMLGYNFDIENSRQLRALNPKTHAYGVALIWHSQLIVERLKIPAYPIEPDAQAVFSQYLRDILRKCNDALSLLFEVFSRLGRQQEIVALHRVMRGEREFEMDSAFSPGRRLSYNVDGKG